MFTKFGGHCRKWGLGTFICLPLCHCIWVVWYFSLICCLLLWSFQNILSYIYWAFWCWFHFLIFHERCPLILQLYLHPDFLYFFSRKLYFGLLWQMLCGISFDRFSSLLLSLWCAFHYFALINYGRLVHIDFSLLLVYGTIIPIKWWPTIPTLVYKVESPDKGRTWSSNLLQDIKSSISAHYLQPILFPSKFFVIWLLLPSFNKTTQRHFIHGFLIPFSPDPLQISRFESSSIFDSMIPCSLDFVPVLLFLFWTHWWAPFPL